MILLLLLLVLLSCAAFVAGYRIGTARSRALAPYAQPAPPAALDAAPEREPIRVAFVPHAAEGTDEWRRAMAALGERMRERGVRLVVFSHGSFVGDDPLALARRFEEAVPGLPELGALARKLRGMTRDGVSRLLGDLSNYTAEYVTTFARATGIDAIEFASSRLPRRAARTWALSRIISRS